jgi:hypothetical protein
LLLKIFIIIDVLNGAIQMAIQFQFFMSRDPFLHEIHLKKTDNEKKRIVSSFPQLNPDACFDDIRTLCLLIDQIQQAVNSNSIEGTRDYFEGQLKGNKALPEEKRNQDSLINDLIFAATHTSCARNIKNAPYHFFNQVNRTQTISNILSKIKKNYILEENFLYIGETKSGKAYGRGKHTASSGIIYEGAWQKGRQIGPSIIRIPGSPRRNGCTYEVIWTKKRTTAPKAKITWDDGTTYEGPLNGHFRPHGFGKKTFPDKCIYEGEWKNGEPDGFGTMIYPGMTPLKGTWYRGVLKKWEPTVQKPDTIEQIEQRVYVHSLKKIAGTHKAKGIPIEAIIDQFKFFVGFDPNNLSSNDQIDLVTQYVSSLDWFKKSDPPAQAGILKFIEVVKNRCFNCSAYNATPQANTAYMKEALSLFAQFIYFMNSPLISEKNKEDALKDFSHTDTNPMIFECSQSVPQRIAGILSIVKKNTIFSDPYCSQRDLLLESFVTEFIRMRADAHLPARIGSQVHFRPWLANFLAEKLKFHTSFESETDPYSFLTLENNMTYLMEDPYLSRVRIIRAIDLDELQLFFSAMIKEQYYAPNIESEVARFVQLLWPFKHKEKLEYKDIKIIEEQFFDELALNCPELEGIMPKYIVPVDPDDEDCTEYQLSEEIFDDLPFLLAHRLVSLGYYSDSAKGTS